MTAAGSAYDVERVRSWFPALTEDVARFDGPGGTQVPRQVADAVAATLVSAISNRGRLTASERRADDVVLGARRAVADLVGGQPDGVVFGRSMTELAYHLGRTLAQDWRPGDEVVVTRLDHDGDVRPWVHAAEQAGAVVRWADFDPRTGELPPESVTAVLSERTRLVALTGASNLIGTRPDVRAVADAAHAVGALVHVDGVHLTPHAPVDVVALGADLFSTSPYKWLGPHHGAMVADPDLLASLAPRRLAPQSDRVPERFELGTLPYELLAGTTAAVEVLADLVPTAGDRRSRLLTSMTAAQKYEHALFERLVAGLRETGRVTTHGAAARRTPTLLFSVDGMTSADVAAHLAERGVHAPAGSFYALEASRHLGLGDHGAVRAGIAPYTDRADVDRLVAAVASL